MRRTACLVFLLLMVLPACTRSSADVHVVTLNEPLPAITGPSVTDGTTLSSATHLGSVLVLNVWATWCGPCRLEQPDLVKVANSYASQGVEFLGVDYEDGDAKAQAWIKRFHVPYPSLSDPAGRSALQLKFAGVPDTIIVDASGTQRYLFFGRTTQAEVSHYLDLVLASPGSASTAPSP